MAQMIVQAYIEHDMKNYQKSAEYFTQVLSHLFPRISRDGIQVAGRTYVDALRNHDTIEESNLTKNEQLTNGGWKEVRESLRRMCQALKISEDYAIHTTEFFRNHGVGDSNFMVHMLRADEIFTSSILKHSRYSTMLGGLYLSCIQCHDLHSEYGIRLGTKLMEIYYSILLENRK